MSQPKAEEVVDVDEELAFFRRIGQERDKVGRGMLSSRYQRFELNVTGKQRGPAPLSGGARRSPNSCPDCRAAARARALAGAQCASSSSSGGKAKAAASAPLSSKRRQWKAEARARTQRPPRTSAAHVCHCASSTVDFSRRPMAASRARATS